MWIWPLSLCLLVIRVLSESDSEPEHAELTNLIIEGLRVNPALLDLAGDDLSEDAKRFITAKLDRFVLLVSESHTAALSRRKRSLEHRDENAKTNSISISSEKVIPIRNADDFRLFQSHNNTLAVSLENGNNIVLYKFSNGSFQRIFQRTVEYKTNLAVVSATENNRPLVILGDNEFVRIFQLLWENESIEWMQNIKLTASKHVTAWKQSESVYLSITDNPDNSPNYISNVKIFKWLGRHFDHIQDIQLSHIKKTVHFTIHGSDYLAAVNEGQLEGGKTYSEIFKFDLHAMNFRQFQPLLTNGCTDIKYFTSKLQGNYHHFLVVVHSSSLTDSSKDNAISVIYKYDEDYFIPFQSIATKAVEWQPVQDLEGHSALIAVTTDGLQGFQYDGWYFFESRLTADIEELLDLKFQNTKTLHTFNFCGKEMLVVACNYCSNSISMYSVKFTQFSALEEAYSELLNWCTSNLQEYSSNDDSPVLTETLRGDLNEEISFDDDRKKHVAAALSQSSEDLYGIEDTFKRFIFNADVVEADTIIFKNHTQVDECYALSINEIGIDRFFDSILNIKDGFQANGTMEFNVVVVDNKFKLITLNGIPLEDYVFINNDLDLDSFTVHGSAAFESGLNIRNNMINDVKVTENNLLLKTGDQEFTGNLTVNELFVNNLTANDLNCFRLESVLAHSSDPIFHIETLKVEKLEIGGLLNNVSIPVLAKRALKKVGDQFWEIPLLFNSLEVEEVNIKQDLSGKMIPRDFILTNSTHYRIHQDVTFTKDVHINELEVSKSLNNISVNPKGSLDVLLIDSAEQQEVPSRKVFKNLVVNNSIRRRNNIVNPPLRHMSPVLIADEAYEISSDLIINGKVEVTQQLKVHDLKSINGNGSIGDVFTNGVKLLDSEMPVHLTFTNPLRVGNFTANKINSLDPHKWILDTSESPQIISGHKQFLGDIHLGGQSHVSRMNNIDVQALEEEVLRIHGDQEINGIWEVDSVVAMKGVFSNKTELKRFDNISNFSPNLLIKNNVEANLNTTALEVKGLVNSKQMQDVLDNLVKKNAEFMVFGEKRFKELHVKNLFIHEGRSNIPNLLRNITSGKLTLGSNLELFNNISINSLTFNGSLNNLSRSDFDNLIHLDSNPEDPVLITSDVQFDEFVVLGDVFINDNYINGKNLTAIERDTVKVDEDHEFHNCVFGEAVTVHDTLHLNGSFENLDLDFIVTQNSTKIVEIRDTFFMDSLFVNGTLFIHNSVNGVDLQKLCTFSEPSENIKTLKIHGDVIFAKGPKVLNFNNLNVKNLKETLWFTDREAHITGNVHLKNVTFNKPIYIQNFLDEINLNLLSKYYLSKSKDQDIPASFIFSNVTFSYISTALLKTNSSINGILIDDVLNTMLLQGTKQVFEAPVYLEEVNINNLIGSFTVNNFSLETDVMRYDAYNVVTGRKFFKNLNVGTLNLQHHIKVQNVDVLDWLNNAVLNNGSFRITGKKIFTNATFKKGLSLKGHFNNQTFNENTIMLLNKAQKISGRKIFANKVQQPMKLRSVRVNGLVNDINLQELVQNHSNRRENTTITSRIVFDSDMDVNDINVDVLYNNLNVSQLILNVTKLSNLEHFQQKFRDLLDMGRAVENSFKDPSTIFKYFKEIIKFNNVYEIFGLRCADGIFRIVAFSFENGRNSFMTFEWEFKSQTFVFVDENTDFYSKPSYMKQLSIGNIDYLFMEHMYHYNYQNGKYIYSGSLMELTNGANFEKRAEFHRSATASLTKFQDRLFNRTCLAFIGHTLPGMDVYCYEAIHQTYYWTQRIPLEGIYKALAVESQDSVYLFLARHGHPLVREPSIVVFQSTSKSSNFEEIQTIFEGATLNGMAAATVNGKLFVAFSFGSQESTIESGRVSIRRLDLSSNLFIPWQHISVPSPLDVEFVTETSFEPLLLISTADPNGPLHTMKYNGVAGFKQVLKGSSLPISSKVRTIGNGHFLVTLQENKKTGIILGAVVKGTPST